MLKHTLIAALLTMGLVAPAVAQTSTATPPPVAANGQKPARVAPRAKRAARLAQLGTQGRAQLRTDLRGARSKLKALRKNADKTTLKARRQLKRQVRTLRLRMGKLKHRGK